MQLIRRDIDHFHFFLEMTREHIIAKVRLHRYMEETKIESVFVFMLLFLHTIYSEPKIFWTVVIGMIIWFKTNGFDFYPALKRIFDFWFLVYSTKKNRDFIVWEVLIRWRKSVALKLKSLKLINEEVIFDFYFEFLPQYLIKQLILVKNQLVSDLKEAAIIIFDWTVNVFFPFIKKISYKIWFFLKNNG